jgi:hypothetical protein
MIDDTIVCEALRTAWEHVEAIHWDGRYDNYDSSLHSSWEKNHVIAMLNSIDDDVESVRKQFYLELITRIPRKESRTFVSTDDIADRIRKAGPSLNISGTKDGIAVEVPGDSIGVSVYKGYKVSVHSRKNHYGWDATNWEPEDIAGAVVAMGRFEELSAPLKEAYRKRCEERKRRADIKSSFQYSVDSLRSSVYSALGEGRDPGTFRDEYLSLRKKMYGNLGDPFDDGLLEKDWKEFVDYIAEALQTDRKIAASEAARKARVDARERARDEHGRKLSGALGRDCWIERRSPYGQPHWDEYLVELEDGEVVYFKDYTRKLGSVDAAILTLIPILEELTTFATTKLKFGRCSSQITYSSHDRSLCRRAFLQMAGGDEVMLHLAERMKSAKVRAILRPAKRTVKLYCFYPWREDMALSFTLGGIGSKEDVDRLADSLTRFQAAMKEHLCDLG